MSDTAVGLLGLGALFVLFVLRMPVGTPLSARKDFKKATYCLGQSCSFA